MDLLSIAQTIWRHKLAAVPVIALTVLAAGYVIAVKAPVYQASSSYLLINPPAPPTSDQVARRPALGRVNSDNPYVRFGDLSIVGELLTQVVSTDSARAALVKEGADPRYVVAPGQRFGLNTPIVQITGVGASAQAAIRTATLVGQAVSDQMGRFQSAQGVDSRYWIRPLEVTAPYHAQVQVSGKLRLLVGVLAVGMILLFVVVSVMNALEERTVRARSRVDEGPVSGGRPADLDLPHRAVHSDLDREATVHLNGGSQEGNQYSSHG